MGWDEASYSSSGGTELMGRRLEQALPADLLEKFQIIVSQVMDVDPDRIPVYWAHLPAREPQSLHLADGGWRRYEKIVFVSNSQAHDFVRSWGIPWSRCAVIPNFIAPIPVPARAWEPLPPDEPVRIVHMSTPGRGLLLLNQAFRLISERRDDVELDVYSSFRIYGWEERDRELEWLYDQLRSHPRINYRGYVPNDQLRAALPQCHVFAYPAIFWETSCLCLIEAMSAGLACVHPNFGALYETAAGQTMMYDYDEDPTRHVVAFARQLMSAIEGVRNHHPGLLGLRRQTKAVADQQYDLGRRVRQWEVLLRGILADRSSSSARQETVIST